MHLCRIHIQAFLPTHQRGQVMKLFVDRCYRKNHWYVINNGTFVAGPFATKGEAIVWMKT